VAWDLSMKRWFLISTREKRRDESHGPNWDSRVAEADEVPAPMVNFDTGFLFWGDSLIMRSYIINKIICSEYHLRKVIGKKMARSICILIEKTFTTLFGREVYHEEG